MSGMSGYSGGMGVGAVGYGHSYGHDVGMGASQPNPEAVRSAFTVATVWGILSTIALIVINSLAIAGVSGFTSGMTVGAINISLLGVSLLLGLNAVRKITNNPALLCGALAIMIIATAIPLSLGIATMTGALSVHTFGIVSVVLGSVGLLRQCDTANTLNS